MIRLRYTGNSPCLHDGRIIRPGDIIDSDGSHLRGHRFAVWELADPPKVEIEQDGAAVKIKITKPRDPATLDKPGRTRVTKEN